MYKLFKTLTLFGSLGLLAFSCETSDTPEGEPPEFMDRVAGSIAIVNLDTINLVGLEDWRVYHPDSIKILDSMLNDTGLRFKMYYTSDESQGFDSIPWCRSQGIDLPYGLSASYAKEHYLEWKYTYYFLYPDGDIDTLRIVYDSEIRSGGSWGDYEFFYTIQTYNGKAMPEPIYLPEYPKHPFFLARVIFKDVN